MNPNKDAKQKTPPVANKERKRNYRRERKKKQPVTNQVREDDSQGYFTGSAIMNNQGVCGVLMELANTFTSNSVLPEEQLSQLKFSVTKKLAALFASLLNNLMSKVSEKIIKDVTQNPTQKRVTVDASCQTDITGDIMPV